MALTIEGDYALTLDGTRNLLAGSAAYRGLLGVTTAAEAKALTWWSLTDDAADYEQAAFPRAIVQFDEPFKSKKQGTSQWVTMTTIEVIIEIDVPAMYVDDLQTAQKWFAVQIGLAVDQMKTLISNRTADSLRSGYTYQDVQEFTIVYSGKGYPENNPNGKTYLVACLLLEVHGGE
jgi:hypothetical protein